MLFITCYYSGTMKAHEITTYDGPHRGLHSTCQSL